jgi:hypothetical protein
MNRRQLFLSTAKGALASTLGWSWLRKSARAQEVLPLPQPPFKGKIGTTYKDSVPDKIPKSIRGSPVSDDYASPNPYTGNLRKVGIHLAP